MDIICHHAFTGSHKSCTLAVSTSLLSSLSVCLSLSLSLYLSTRLFLVLSSSHSYLAAAHGHHLPPRFHWISQMLYTRCEYQLTFFSVVANQNLPTQAWKLDDDIDPLPFLSEDLIISPFFTSM